METARNLTCIKGNSYKSECLKYSKLAPNASQKQFNWADICYILDKKKNYLPLSFGGRILS